MLSYCLSKKEFTLVLTQILLKTQKFMLPEINWRSAKLSSEVTYFVQALELSITVCFVLLILKWIIYMQYWQKLSWNNIITYCHVEYIPWFFEEGDIGGFEYCNTTKKWQIPHYHKKAHQVPQNFNAESKLNVMLKPLLSMSVEIKWGGTGKEWVAMGTELL